jgi:multicomponent Na+:H+ antiporter subunit A
LSLSFDVFAVILLLSPFGAALLATTISRETGRAAGWILAIVPAALFAVLLTTVPDIAAGHPVKLSLDWVPALDLSFSFLIDGLGLVFALLITGIGTFIVLYSGSYLHGHPHRGRFLAFMLLFMGAMLGLVLADSFVVLFVFWELTSVTSFLLIGFDHEREAARRGAIQALIVTGIGGLALMAGGVLLHQLSGTWTISELASSERLHQQGGAYYLWVLCFIAFAAFTKSAQWPFHFWLPNAMEAPTPVSAYLHSATMVQAGVYLLARMSPILAGTPQWQVLLVTFGGITLLWGGIVALRQTDLKQILAQTTIASLGLSVLLLGLGGEAAAMAVAAYFVAHALYKAALFLVAGIIDHGTGTRDITQLGGLRDTLTFSFIGSALAALSMFGMPPLMGYLAKEEMYAAASTGNAWGIVVVVVMVVGNALLGAIGLVVGFRPYLGDLKPTPHPAHEGGFTLWIGPALFGLVSLAVLFAVSTYGEIFLAPMASSIAGYPLESHLGFAVDLRSLPIWLSVATWSLGIVIYLRFDWLQSALQAVIPSRMGTLSRKRPTPAIAKDGPGSAPLTEVEAALDRSIEQRAIWTLDRGFDQVMFSLVRFAGGWTRAVHHGRLELYVVVALASFALVLLVPLWTMGGWPALPQLGEIAFYEWGIVAMAAIGVVMVVFAPTRLGAIISLGVQGLAVALIFMLFGAPDLAFTQLMVETLSVVILALVMTRLHLSTEDPRPYEDLARDGILALVIGIATSLLLLRVLEGVFDGRLSAFFAQNSVEIAHGRNIVNVILVDFRGLDTLGEITVVMTAGIAVLALLRRQHKREPVSPKPRRAPRRKAAAA